MSSRPSELYVLCETAAGFVLVHVKEWEGIASGSEQVQESFNDPSMFKQIMDIKAVHPFQNAEEALTACTAIAAGDATENLITFLDQNLPKKRKKCQLGIADPNLAKNLAQQKFPVMYDKSVLEIMRVARFHLQRLVKEFSDTNITRFQVGLGHSYSRSKIKTDPHRQDKPVQNAVALLENITKTLNTFCMRVKEWYSWHFPELATLVTDNVEYAKVVQLIGMKEQFEPNRLNELTNLLNGDENLSKQIMAALLTSMGQEISSVDMMNILKFTSNILSLAEQRSHLTNYLTTRLQQVAPNLQSLVGDVLAAKLITHAGSLTNLCKCPASTIQILGAEKALFRALKTKGKTPKYGLLFQSSFVGRAAAKNKGRISRYVANKCSLAARIDNFATVPCNIFGEKLRNQVEARMENLLDGVSVKRNIDVMTEAAHEVARILGTNKTDAKNFTNEQLETVSLSKEKLKKEKKEIRKKKETKESKKSHKKLKENHH